MARAAMVPALTPWLLLHAARLLSAPPLPGGLVVEGWMVSPASSTHLSRMGFSCSSSGLALPRIRFRASAYSASR